ncbi:hypothetical protein SCHPADRAFT_994068 [Schizopora paradoxa]|uniref:RING-CH-type domain-containing protein n=1 Tax=Schizopora paradoxa TaxID=27342 RepID=A0A0H2S054_9AGAM|nr:hypothetical protein SCHPADRAFT_994068 [Schizopora paradoxa]
MPPQSKPVPTIDDLRVKLCYICREEESWDKPTNPPTKWVHPCTCTLIAHEACLLEWIKTSEVSRDRTPANFLKCPQCGSRYEVESKNPFVLRLMDLGSMFVTIAGHTATVMTVGAVVASVGTGIYILLSGHGAFTLHQFVGDEMYELMLADDPSKWPLHAYFALPLFPIILFSSQTRRYQNLVPLTSVILSWPSIPPVNMPSARGSIFSILSLSKAGNQLPPLYNSLKEMELATLKDMFFSWPPSPFMLSIIIPGVRSLYRVLLAKLRRRVLGSSMDLTGANAVGGDEDWRVELRLRNADDQAPAPAEGQVGRDLEANMDGAANEQLRALARDDAQVVVQVDGVIEINGEQVDDGVDEPERRPAPAGNAPAPPNQAGAPRRRDGDRNLMLLTGGVLGRLLGGALIIPTAASMMGSLLLRLALPSVKNAHRRINSLPVPKGISPRYLLQKFLAIRPPGSALLAPLTYLNADLEKLPSLQVFRYFITASNRGIFVGSPAWTTADPVWWRNIVGLGVWFVAKDCFTLAHQWLTRREIISRHVKDRSFFGIDPKELDLKPSSRIRFE